MKKVIKSVLTMGIALIMFGTAAFAGASYSGYNTIVGKFNGCGYSGYQTKATGGANGYIMSTMVGGDYEVDVRMTSSSGSGSWLRNVTDGTWGELQGSSYQTSGTSVRAQFSNDISTPVDVQVTGQWKSN